MTSYKCPFCSIDFPFIMDTYRATDVSFDKLKAIYGDRVNRVARYPSDYLPNDLPQISIPNMAELNYSPDPYEVTIHFFKCPSCKKISIIVSSYSAELNGLEINVSPKSKALQFPQYVPEQIRSDYEESYAIVNLSPKASATLARRCLQSIVRDFWGISGRNLYDELSQLQSIVYPTLWQTIDAIRQIGNIGAHPENDINLIVDVEPHEAENILKVIEILIKNSYVQRYEQEQLFLSIQTTNSSLQSQRQP